MFLGCDTSALRAWAQNADLLAGRLSERVEQLRAAVTTVPWAGPDRDAFVDAFTTRVDHVLDAAASGIRDSASRAVQDADEQDRTSDPRIGTGQDGGPGGSDPSGGRNGGSPGQTTASGPPVPVPDDVRHQVDDVDAIRKKALEVEQGNMGDCYFLASLAAVAQTNPEFIERNIWYSDGKYHVRMYEDGWGGTREVVVDVDPSVAQNGARDGDGNISWMSVYEAAYAQHKGGYDDIEEGGFAHDALPTITGKQAFTYDDEPSLGEIRTAFDNGCVVVADTAVREGDDGGWWDVVNNDDGPVPRDTVASHQYVVRGFTEDGRIILQNPWGEDGGYEKGDDVHKPGQLVLTEAEYKERFENVTVTHDPDTSNPKQPIVVEP